VHHVQFDVTTGEALNNPIPEHIDDTLPGRWMQYLRLPRQFPTLLAGWTVSKTRAR
jgi:hypothetical protein